MLDLKIFPMVNLLMTKSPSSLNSEVSASHVLPLVEVDVPKAGSTDRKSALLLVTRLVKSLSLSIASLSADAQMVNTEIKRPRTVLIVKLVALSAKTAKSVTSVVPLNSLWSTLSTKRESVSISAQLDSLQLPGTR